MYMAVGRGCDARPVGIHRIAKPGGASARKERRNLHRLAVRSECARVRARAGAAALIWARACARRVRWSITSQCRHMTTQDPTAAPRTQLINLRRALEALDAEEHGAWASQASVPKRELAPPKGRSPVNAADLARGVAAAPTKKRG